MIKDEDLKILALGPCEIESPLKKFFSKKSEEKLFITDEKKVVFDVGIESIEKNIKTGEKIPFLELAGPRPTIYFEPEKTTAAIVTCGGICPGLNDVIRSLVMALYYRYGVKKILGIRYGYEGLVERLGHKPAELSPKYVSEIHRQGGTILGTSRGNQDSGEILDFIEKNKIDILFTIGGDGTLRGAVDIAKEAEKRKRKISIIGIPKTVDNDILYIDRSFGITTAVSVAVSAIETAHSEAMAQKNGIGLVKLMGRNSGFIACFAALAMNDANFVLIPESPFDLDGKKGFLNVLSERLARRNHAVILVAEGAGQKHTRKGNKERDASGNVKFNDIGLFLKEVIDEYFKERNTEVNLKYIDPSYLVRAVEANPVDSAYCFTLGENAVHAAMAGKTNMVMGLRNNCYVHFPMALIAKGRKQVDPHSHVWLSVLEATGQPADMTN